MLVNKVSRVYRELEITGVTLLSMEEAETVPERLRKARSAWWLRYPNNGVSAVATIQEDGKIRRKVSGTYFPYLVRPALKINISETSFSVGDRFVFGKNEFEIISKTLAFCTGDIGEKVFSAKLDKDPTNTDYETSSVKEFLIKWFNRSAKTHCDNTCKSFGKCRLQKNFIQSNSVCVFAERKEENNQ